LGLLTGVIFLSEPNNNKQHCSPSELSVAAVEDDEGKQDLSISDSSRLLPRLIGE
jgi:hypothetical protein